MRSRAFLLVTVIILLSIQLTAQDNNLSTDKISEGFYNIRVSFMNFDSNILVVEGEEGLLLVDAGYDVTSEEVYQAIRSISNKPVKYLINTHAHMDHYGGNAKMGKVATLIVHESARSEITGEYYSLGSNPRFDLPVISFKDELTLHIYGQKIKITTLQGHTGNDVVVEFPDANIICAGGLIYSYQFPIIDRGRGGDLDDFIISVKYLYENNDDEVVIIPSHGSRYSKKDLAEHFKMLVSTSDLIKKEIESGSTIEEMINADLLKEWEDWQGTFSSKDTWITMVYNSVLKTEINAVISISEPLTETIMNSGVKAAIDQFYLLKETNPNDFNFGENEINMLGYNLMYRAMYEESEKIFQLNIELFPESSNVYDSLGELYMNTAKKALAIEYYERSLQLNPDNTNAEIMIEKIKQQ
jgi:cyclase